VPKSEILEKKKEGYKAFLLKNHMKKKLNV